MSNDVIQAKYDQLDAIARKFEHQAQATGDLRSRIRCSAQALEQGGWQGRGAAAFFVEMNTVVDPAMQRLIHALEEARAVTLEASEIMRVAEEEAASVFKSGGASDSGSGGNQAEGSWWSQWGEWVHGALDGLGFIPGFGEVADGVNGLIYLGEGRKIEAGISFAAMIPIFGDAGKLGKYGVKAGKELLEEVAETGTKQIAKESAERALREGAETAGERGARETGEFLKFGELAPGSKYVRNGYEYATDEVGRVNHVSGELRLETAPRTEHQTEVGKMGLPGDEGGHLIGSRFGGTPEGVNLVPQNGNLNKGAWKRMENEWADALGGGKRVEVNITVKYPQDGTGRPADFIVQYTIDGVTRKRTFRNQPGG